MAKQKSINDVWAKLDKNFGDRVRVASSPRPKPPAMSTGCLSLDIATGIGGIPRSRIVEYAGAESSGKTMLSLLTIAEVQRTDPEAFCAFVDAEYTFDEKWATQLGVDLDRCIHISNNDGPEIFTELCGAPSKTSKNKSRIGLLDMAIQGELKLPLIVIDSVAAIKPPHEIASIPGSYQIAPLARFLPAELRRMTDMLYDAQSTAIFINQVRVDPGKMFGNPEGSPGGKALKHAISMRIHVAAVHAKDSKIIRGGEEVGHTVRAKIEKNKLAAPFKKVTFEIEYVKGVVNRYKEVADLAITYNLANKPNNVTIEYGDEKFRGTNNFYDFIKSNPDIMDKLEVEIRKLQHEGYNPILDEDSKDTENNETEGIEEQ